MTITISELTKSSRACKVLDAAFDISFSDVNKDTPTWFKIFGPETFSVIATEGAGGVFLLGTTSGSILYVTSEGQAGVIANSLTELLQLVVAHPYWRDLLKFSGGGSITEMARAVPYLEHNLLQEQPDIQLQRNLVNQALSLSAANDPVSSLHSAVTCRSGNIKVLAPDESECDSLFGSFTISDIVI